MQSTTVAACLLTILAFVAEPSHAAVQLSNVFVGGAEGPEGTPNYRIPSLIAAPNGNLIAFAEARPSTDDPGQDLYRYETVKVVSKISTDGGATWGALNVIARDADRDFSYSDPRPVVDAVSGRLLLHYTQWPHYVHYTNLQPGTNPSTTNAAYYRASADNGQTWSDPVDITSQVKDPAWPLFCTGAGVGIQLRWQTDPARNGRLVVPAWVAASNPATGTFNDYSYFSDDHGATWSRSPLMTAVKSDESQIVELTNGDLLLDGRQWGDFTNPSASHRNRWISRDGGATWGEAYVGDIPVTYVNCGLIRYSAKRDGDDRDRLLFSGPLGAPALSASDRSNMSVWTSYDEGKSFINPVQISSGYGGYSSMQKLRDGSIAMLYEHDPGFNRLTLARLTMGDLEGRNVSPHLAEYDGFGNNIDRKRGGMGWSGSWIGDGTATDAYSVRLGGTGLRFAGSTMPTQDGRMDLISGQNAERQLATPMNLNANATRYVSLLVSQALDTSSDLSANEALDIYLRDASQTSLLCFGVGSSENFFLSGLGDVVTTATGALKRSGTYLLVLKIVSADDGSPGNYDQLFLKIFESGADALPATDTGLAWTLVGSTNMNASGIIDRILLSGGSEATWSVDELRIGDTFDAVVLAPEPAFVVLVLSAAATLPFCGLRRRSSHSPLEHNTRNTTH
jgi:sialidase-1